MPSGLDVSSWRIANPEEVVAFTERLSAGRRRPKSRGSLLVLRRKIKQADFYAYLRARFGEPNGFQNFLRSDSSDNLIHWDYLLKTGDDDVYIQGVMRDVHVIVSRELSDEEWKYLILSVQADFARLGKDKSRISKSFERYVVFQNKFVVLAGLCADLHGAITDAPPQARSLPRVTTKKSMKEYQKKLEAVARRAANLYGDCLKLRLLTPIMAEAFINMMILVFCKSELRSNSVAYGNFLREKIPEKLALMSENCVGFSSGINTESQGYRNFLRVMNERNFIIHGNVDPAREQIETIYFEGKRPLFTEGGDHSFRLFEHLEMINKPEKVVRDYEDVHAFLLDLRDLLAPRFRNFFDVVIDDPFPGYETKVHRVTRLFPDYTAAMLLPNQKSEDELAVEW